jgi:hypothetical protein
MAVAEVVETLKQRRGRLSRAYAATFHDSPPLIQMLGDGLTESECWDAVERAVEMRTQLVERAMPDGMDS